MFTGSLNFIANFCLLFQKDKRNADEIIIDIQVLQDAYLPVPSSFQGSEDDPSIHKLLACFRELCCILWMLYARDKLSLMLRQKHALLQRKASRQKVSQAELQLQCQDTLQWALHMLPFSRYLDGEYELYSAALSQVVELPANESTALIMVDHFYDFESLHPEIQEKLKVLQKEWQGVFLGAAKGKQPQSPTDSPRGMTLSVYFQRQARKMERLLSRKAKTFGHYETFQYDPGSSETEAPPAYVQNGITFVGSRPFESTEDYLKFLDMFYAVSFTKIVDAERASATGPEMPLLLQFAADIRTRELNSLPHRAITSLQKRQSLQENSVQSLGSPRQASAVSVPAVKKQKSKETGKLPPSPKRKIGLFRSRSLTDVSAGKTKVRQASMSPVRERSSSDLNLSNVGIEDINGEPLVQAGNKPPSKPQKPKLERSTSVASGERAKSEQTHPRADPLAVLLLQAALLENMDFGDKYKELEQLLEWLTRWVDRNHSVVTAPDARLTSTKASIKMKMIPRIIIYGLWQVEYNNDARMKRQGPSEPREDSKPIQKKKKKDRVEVPREDDQHNISITGLDNDNVDAVPASSAVKQKDKKKKKKKKKEHKEDVQEVMHRREEMNQVETVIMIPGGSTRFDTIEPEIVTTTAAAPPPLDDPANFTSQREPTNR